MAAARADVHRAATSWSDTSVLLLGYLVRLGEPVAVLAAARAQTARGASARRGPAAERTPTRVEWAVSGVLSMWRDVARALALPALPAPADAFDALQEGDPS